MQKVRLWGRIGGNGMKPTKSTNANGNIFMRFSMFVENERSQPDKDGNRKREIWQVILPSTERHEKLFEHLSAGRLVEVEGDYDQRPRARVDGDKLVAYANPICHMKQLNFLDNPIQTDVKRILNQLVRAEILSEETASEYRQRFDVHLAKQYEKNPPRIVKEQDPNDPSQFNK